MYIYVDGGLSNLPIIGEGHTESDNPQKGKRPVFRGRG